ncbi:MAG: penicillin acylase family protein, partial [Alphaproteobacteria bacterium]|nr:penicillin acylase family protein [Alphaproteobacteria bacterium]
ARRQGGWEPLRLTKEVIRRKGAADHVLTSISTSHGLLECGDGLPKDGRYLAIANSTRGGGAAASLAAILAAPEARDVREAQAILRNSALSGNWVLADAEGHIAYQQSGWLPERAKPGLAPTLGWAPEPHWLGRVPGEHLAALVDPPGGVLATANDGADRPGVALAMGDDRVDRIRALIGDRKGLTAADMTAIQADLFSLQADRLLAAFLPDMEEGPVKTALAAWDRRYDAASKGATLFERFYGALCEEVFGAGFFGREAWRRMVDETALFAAYFSLFDRALLSGDGVWFKPRGRKAVMAAALAKLASDAPAWGEVNRFTFTQLFFAGLLPKWTGFDRGPFPMPGGRATISQGQLMTAYGRRTSFAPSWRCVADFGEGGIHTALPGGPSDRRFSRLYASDLERYLAFATKRLDPGGL